MRSLFASACDDSVLNVDKGCIEKAMAITVTGMQVEIKCSRGSSRVDSCIAIRAGHLRFKLTGLGTIKHSGITF